MKKTLFYLLVIAIVPVSCKDDEDGASLNKGLQAHYAFDGNAEDETGNHSAGVVTGDITLIPDRDENGNMAYNFGVQGGEITLGNILDDLQLPFTVSAWIKPEDINKTVILSTQDNASVSLHNGFVFMAGPNSIIIQYGNGQGEGNEHQVTKARFNMQSKVGEWIHVCAVVKGGEDIALYVNGNESGGNYSGEPTIQMESNFPNDVARVGRMTSYGFLSFFEGGMDELKVWNRALSASEVKKVMNQ